MATTTEEKKFLIVPLKLADVEASSNAHSNLNYTSSDPEVSEECALPEYENVSIHGEEGSEVGTCRSNTPNNLAFEFIPLIYSEPALFNLCETPCNLQKQFAASDTLLPHMREVAKAMENQAAEQNISVSHAPSVLTVTNDDKNMYQSDMSVYGRQGHKPSFSTREIREQHAQMQQKYRDVTKKERKVTDPIDFEGILNIIGGCRWWQIWIYVLIALQQIPHAMFNLNVVYMMYDPEFQCMVPGFNDINDTTIATNGPYLWGVDDIKNISFVFPNSNSDGAYIRDSCYFYERSEERYRELRRMPLEEAMKEAWKDVAPKRKCQAYHFENDVMRETIVTDFNLVCDSWLAKGHAHMFYSIGYLLGCVLGGIASDRIGRKPTIIGFGVLSSMFGVFLPFNDYYPMFLFIRLLSAICNEAADLAAYTLCMEITGMKYRAMIGSMLQAPWALGYALLALIAYLTKSWKTIQVIAAGLHFIAVILVCSIPESPRWLMTQNRVSEAEEVIRKACRDPPFPFNLCRTTNCGNLPSDLELVCHRERKLNKKNGKISFLDLFLMKELRYRTISVCIVFMATALVYYGLVMALSDQSAPGRTLFTGYFHLNNGIAGAIEIPTLFACVWMMTLGRKKALMLTLTTAGFFIIIAMLAVTAGHYMWALTFMLLGKIAVQGAFNILYIFTSELYPTVIRNTAVGVTSMVARFGSGLSSYIALLSNISLPIVPMIIFAVFSLFAAMLVIVLPETSEKPLPETLDDAITFLEPTKQVNCVIGRFGVFGGKANQKMTKSISLTENPSANDISDLKSSSRRSSAITRRMNERASVIYSRNASRTDSLVQEIQLSTDRISKLPISDEELAQNE